QPEAFELRVSIKARVGRSQDRVIGFASSDAPDPSLALAVAVVHIRNKMAQPEDPRFDLFTKMPHIQGFSRGQFLLHRVVHRASPCESSPFSPPRSATSLSSSARKSRNSRISAAAAASGNSDFLKNFKIIASASVRAAITRMSMATCRASLIE